jgi:hypothetical protein
VSGKLSAVPLTPLGLMLTRLGVIVVLPAALGAAVAENANVSSVPPFAIAPRGQTISCALPLSGAQPSPELTKLIPLGSVMSAV